ncbi:hypothetical protein B566_EDAN007455 [Ephemera danica]|nr:hypothetical protein B566_EDAN007455 [Ephemera danica]
MEQSGLEKNKEGWITVVVAAFPPPELHWRADELNITAESEQYKTHPAQKIFNESGRWEANLRIKNVSDADFDKKFILTATNELGSENYVVKISGLPHNATMLALIAGFASFLLVIIIASIILICWYKPAAKPGARKLENVGDNDGYLTPRPAAEPVYDVLKYDDGEEEDNHMYEYVTAPRPRPDAPLIQHFNDPVPLYRDVPLPPSGPIPFIDAPNLPSEREEEYEDVPTPQPHAMANGLKPIQFTFPSPENRRSYENVSSTVV